MSSTVVIFEETDSSEENKNHVSSLSSHQSRRTLFPGIGDADFFWLLRMAGWAFHRAEPAPGHGPSSPGCGSVGCVRGAGGSYSFRERSNPCSRDGAADAGTSAFWLCYLGVVPLWFYSGGYRLWPDRFPPLSSLVREGHLVDVS